MISIMGDNRQKRQQEQETPERRMLRFPIRGRDPGTGAMVDSGEVFEFEVWVPSGEQLLAVRGGLASALDGAEGEMVETLADLVATFVLRQAVDPAQSKRLMKLLWGWEVSTLAVATSIMESVVPEGSEVPNREDRRAAVKATRTRQQGGGGHGRHR